MLHRSHSNNSVKSYFPLATECDFFTYGLILCDNKALKKRN
jgi:hypothetical protein